jgi:hypothetical protein
MLNCSIWPNEANALISAARDLAGSVSQLWTQEHKDQHNCFWSGALDTLLQNEVPQACAKRIGVADFNHMRTLYEAHSLYGWLALAGLSDGYAVKYSNPGWKHSRKLQKSRLQIQSKNRAATAQDVSNSKHGGCQVW